MYWGTGDLWIVEGGASLMERVTMNAVFGSPIGPPFTICTLARNIREFDQVVDDLYASEPKTAFDTIFESGCSYSLGQGLFLDLYHELGRETFRQGFTELYMLLDSDKDSSCQPRQGIDYVRESFVGGANPDIAAIAERIIDEWYAGDPFN